VAAAVDILRKNLRAFAPMNPDLYTELSSLLALDNIRCGHAGQGL
jgi:hypothetical protein